MKRKKRSFLLLLVAICFLCGPFSVKWNQNPMVIQSFAASPRMSNKKVTLNQGFPYKLKMLHVSKRTKITWRSSKPSVVSIKSKQNTCTLTGRKPGKAVITAKIKKKKYTCQVTVKKKPALSESKKTLKKGQTFTVTLKNADSGKVKWTTSSKKVLKIASYKKNKCRVVALKSGKATLKAVYGKRSYRCNITVKTPVTNPALSFTGESSSKMQVNFGEVFSLEVNNKIKQVSISSNGIISSLGNGSTNCSFAALEPGIATVTICDIYNQKITSQITITQKFGSTIFTSVSSNPSLPVPKIEAIYHTADEIVAKCPGNTYGNEPYTTYEYYLSTHRDFHSDVKTCLPFDSVKENGRDMLSGFFGGYSSKLTPGAVYYLKVRSVVINGTTKVCGPWSEVHTVSLNNDQPQLPSKPVYSYDLFFLDSLGPDLYTDCRRVFYIKTDNPDPSTISVVASGQKRPLICKEVGFFYKDIPYLDSNDYDQMLKRVEGGYVGSAYSDTPGDYQVEVREHSNQGYVVAKKMTWTVKDYTKEADAWIDRIIAENTTPSMTPFEKMTAVCNYLLGPNGFKYLTMSNGKIVNLASMPNEPFFKSYRWDSATSPSVLCDIAERIGGFDDIHNCFLDYPPGSVNWSYTHYFVKLTIGSETQRFQACPFSKTGDVGPNPTIDFSDLSKMTPAD